MKRNLIETIMGAIVLAAAIFFVFNTYKSSGVSDSYGYQLTAVFDRIDGISTGSDIRIGGIKVGAVTGQKLDTDTYRARVVLGINSDVRIPTDSTAEIVSDGLLGGKYINLVPGAEMEMLSDGGEIEYTQSSVNLEQLIGKVAFGSSEAEAGESVQAAEVPKTEAKPVVQQPSLTPSLLDDKPAAETPVAEEAPVVEPAKTDEKPAAEPVVIRLEKKTDEENKPVVTRSPAPAPEPKTETVPAQ